MGILGPGAIGGVFAAQLAKNDLTLFARGATRKALENGIILHHGDGQVSHISAASYKLAVGTEKVDVAIICTKSEATSQMADLCCHILSEQGMVMSIQNGLGHSQTLADKLGWNRVLSASTIHGATRIGLNEVRWTGMGSINIGSLHPDCPQQDDPRVEQLLAILQAASLKPQWVDDISRILWVKLLLNVAINPIAAISAVENGAILADEKLLLQADAVMHESLAVAHAEGINIEHPEMFKTLIEVLESTASNKCSMLQDVLAGRVTEIESLCGEVVRRAEAHGIATPLNNQLIALVKSIEGSNPR